MIRQYACGAGKVIVRQVIVTTGFYFNQQRMHGQISSYIPCVWKMMSLDLILWLYYTRLPTSSRKTDILCKFLDYDFFYVAKLNDRVLTTVWWNALVVLNQTLQCTEFVCFKNDLTNVVEEGVLACRRSTPCRCWVLSSERGLLSLTYAICASTSDDSEFPAWLLLGHLVWIQSEY